MAEEEAPPPKLLYIAVSDGGGRWAFRYTRPVLQSTLHLMGCKPRHAFKVHLFLPLACDLAFFKLGLLLRLSRAV
jgi:hypothetical protein